VLNRRPPEPPRSGLEWQIAALPEPTPLPGEAVSNPAAEEWSDKGVDPGIWARPATWSESD
jgi:hypothetical protein